MWWYSMLFLVKFGNQLPKLKYIISISANPLSFATKKNKNAVLEFISGKLTHCAITWIDKKLPVNE